MMTQKDIMAAIKPLGLDPGRFDRVSMHQYRNVIDRVEKTFIPHGSLHWSNLGRLYDYVHINVHFNDGRVGYRLPQLHSILPDPGERLYLLAELRGEDDRDKYWVYEGFLEETILFIDEVVFGEFYLVSRKMQWLVSEHHHSGLVLCGSNLKTERFDYGRLVADTFGEFSLEALAYKKGEDIIWRSVTNNPWPPKQPSTKNIEQQNKTV